MLRASLTSVLGRKLRLLMSAFAVILGVAFVAGSFIFTDTLAKSFDGIMSSSVGDVVVRPVGSGDAFGSTQTLSGDLIAELEKVTGAAGVASSASSSCRRSISSTSASSTTRSRSAFPGRSRIRA